MNFEELKKLISGEVIQGVGNLSGYSHDASIFEITPNLAVKPRDADDLKKLVKFIAENKTDNPELSLTARAAGSDMSGGPLNDSVIVDFANFNRVLEVGDNSAVTEPGVFYRDFEKETLAKGLLLPSYPASREMCTVGGMVANNAGGEKSLKYGKTENFVEELSVVLSDGNEYSFRPLDLDELESKKSLTGFEGEIYRKMYALLEQNYDQIQDAKPKVSKNSAGYALWNVWPARHGFGEDGARQAFDLTKLFTGSQGTLGLITKIKFRLIKPNKVSKLLVLFLINTESLGRIINDVMSYKPESFEAYDDHTLKLAIRFLPGFIKSMRGNFLSFAFSFLPELWFMLTGGIPKLVLLAEFTGDDEAAIVEKIEKLQANLELKYKLQTRIARNSADAQKYWTMRRESFNLLRKYVGGKKTAPFIDDVIVLPEKLGDFLPRLAAVLAPYKNLVYTLAGHAGDGNFHIIPLMNLDDQTSSRTIQELSEKVYNLVIELGGSITAEHNDGLIRTPYLAKMFGPEMVRLFGEVKRIFDPQNIFNPRKKVGGDMAYAMNHIKKN